MTRLMRRALLYCYIVYLVMVWMAQRIFAPDLDDDLQSAPEQAVVAVDELTARLQLIRQIILDGERR